MTKKKSVPKNRKYKRHDNKYKTTKQAHHDDFNKRYGIQERTNWTHAERCEIMRLRFDCGLTAYEIAIKMHNTESSVANVLNRILHGKYTNENDVYLVNRHAAGYNQYEIDFITSALHWNRTWKQLENNLGRSREGMRRKLEKEATTKQQKLIEAFPMEQQKVDEADCPERVTRFDIMDEFASRLELAATHLRKRQLGRGLSIVYDLVAECDDISNNI